MYIFTEDKFITSRLKNKTKTILFLKMIPHARLNNSFGHEWGLVDFGLD